MEYENHYSSNGKGNLGVTLGAIGTGLGIMSGGLNGLGLFNNNRSCEGDHFVNRYESQQNVCFMVISFQEEGGFTAPHN